MSTPTLDGAFSERVNAAMVAVDRDSYVVNADGTVVPQSSSDHIIATLLDQLDVQPGMTVFEIGTGSGYSTALLANLVGPGGYVTSIDIDPVLVDRADSLLARQGVTSTTVLAGDGARDVPTDTRFDRIIGWATAHHIPSTWIKQTTPGAIIVVPVQLSGLAITPGIVRLRLDNQGRLASDRLMEGGFVPMHDTADPEWTVPAQGVDAMVRDTQGKPWWLSAHWLRSGNQAVGERLLRQLITDAHEAVSPLDADENPVDFRAYLTATQPDGLTTAALGSPLWRVGHTIPSSAALIPAVSGHELVHTGSPASLESLAGWVDEWRRLGRPGHDAVEVELRPSADGWTVRTRLPDPHA
jgi:protein-L-isoaspartate(D-aspartate) O-methyltransferase